MSEEAGSAPLLDETTAPNQTLRIVKDLVAGTLGGVAQVAVGQPFDTTKVRLQTSATNTSTLQIVRDLLKNEGPQAFYKGMLTPLVGVGACVSLQFGVNEYMKRFFRVRNNAHGNSGQQLTLGQYYLCGVAGGLANSFIATPIEHVKIRLQLQKQKGQFSGPIDCFRHLWKRGELMRGLNAMFLRAGHGLGVYFLTYEALILNNIHNGHQRHEIPAWKLCSYGAMSGITLWASVYPIDVVKSIIQSVDASTAPTMLQVTKRLYAQEGLLAFFRGFGPTMLRAAPANAATFVVFELAMRCLE